MYHVRLVHELLSIGFTATSILIIFTKKPSPGTNPGFELILLAVEARDFQPWSEVSVSITTVSFSPLVVLCTIHSTPVHSRYTVQYPVHSIHSPVAHSLAPDAYFQRLAPELNVFAPYLSKSIFFFIICSGVEIDTIPVSTPTSVFDWVCADSPKKVRSVISGEISKKNPGLQHFFVGSHITLKRLQAFIYG